MLTKQKRKHEPEVATEEEIDESLSAIYGEERDDLKVVTRGGSRLTRFLVRAVIVLLLLCVAAIGGYLIYAKFFAGSHEGKPLSMAWVVPDELQSGVQTTIELDYANQTSYPLTGVEIDINLPPGFVVKNTTPSVASVQDAVFDLGTIAGRTDGKILIDGVWNVDVPSTTGIQALAAYKPANFNAQFHDILTKTVVTNTSTTVVQIDAPATVNAGESVLYTIHVQNSGVETLVAPRVILTLPTGFFVQTSAPPLASGGDSSFTLSDILTTAEGTIAITGAFASDVSGSQTLTVVSGIAGTRFSPQATATAITDVHGSALAITMVGNGSSGAVVADPGSLFHLALRIENTSTAPVSDATAMLDFTAEDNLPIDWKSALLAGGKITANGIAFDSKTLGMLAPGDHKTLDLSFPLKSDLSAVSSAFSVAFTATHGAITVQAVPLSVTLNSDASVTSALRYYDVDGAPLGSGPLPPTVGNTTHYRALWTIASGLHSMNSVTVSATLPADVAWDNFSSATSGLITYDPSSRIVRWTLSSIPSDTAALSAQFSVSITPSAADVGLEKTMVGKTIFSGKDDSTNTVIERTADAITTACDGDALVVGKGTVK